MNQEIINKVDELLIEIANWPEIKEINELEKDILIKYSNLINIFNKEKDKFDEVFRYGKHHPNYFETLKSFGIAKENLYNKEEVRKYFILSDEVRTKLQDIIDIIAKTISPTGFNKGGNVCVTKF